MNSIKVLIATVMLLLGSLSQASQLSQSWNFKVFLDDREIGEHNFNLSSVRNAVHVTTSASFDVYILFINAYSYRHKNHEIWNGSCLKSIHSTTDDNGTHFRVAGKTINSKLHVTTNDDKYVRSGCVKTFAYWDPSFLQSEMLLNSQTGEIVPVSISYIGPEEIQVRNESVTARRYQLVTDEFTIDLWYSKQDEWLALNSTTPDGNILRYKMQ
jgi:hypothetical protein